MNCKQAVPYMHHYLDGDLNGAAVLELKAHLADCPDCHKHFEQLQKADALFRSLESRKVAAPSDMTDRILRALPAPPKRKSWVNWVRRHPAMTAAAMFLVVMLSSFFSLWNEDTELIVRGKDLEQVEIHGNTVVVPEGRTVQGDLVVENGNIQVDGSINGNLVVIDGDYAMASTANIAGHITKVDQAVQWLWYKMNQFVAVLAH